jgi:hypothetical protein
MTAEPWLHEIKHGITPTISFECDYCATTRRKRDITCWALCGVANDPSGCPLQRVRAKHALGLDPGVETGSREENDSNDSRRGISWL